MKNKVVMPEGIKEEIIPEQDPEKFDYSSVSTEPGSYKSREAHIAVPSFDGLLMVSISEIVKCIAHESYTELFIKDGSKHMVCRTLKEYDDILSPFNFFRIHNSCLVNLRHVKKYIKGEGGYLLMSDNSSCEVSRRKKHELIRRLSIIEF